MDIFFVISGYLITSILIRDEATGRRNFGRFYQRRIARLLPSFVVVAVATLIASRFVYSSQDFASTGAGLAAATIYVANLKFLAQGDYFALSPDAQPFLHCWSLSLEEQFYLLFPVAFAALGTCANKRRSKIMVALCVVSFASSVLLTPIRPTWAFYLLPTRAWELLAGSLTVLGSWERQIEKRGWQPSPWGQAIGLALIAISFAVISEGPTFPGYAAMLPVLGTLCILGSSSDPNGAVERALAWTPLVLVGRLSYSLYLWHWPIFSLVDYKLLWTSLIVRSIVKIALTVPITLACFFLVEAPARALLNRPGRRLVAFGFLACTLVVLVPVGVMVRRANYVNVEREDVARGGTVYNRDGKKGTIVLTGDSHASMYGKVLVNIAEDLGVRLDILSVAAGDPLPETANSSSSTSFWQESLSVVRQAHPDIVLLVCNWMWKLDGDRSRLGIAIDDLKQYAGHIVLITQPPVLPPSASREGIRNGSRPPFREDQRGRRQRLEANAWVTHFATDDRVIAIDIERYFQGEDGGIRFADHEGRELYHDRDHLTGAGAALVEDDLRRAIADVMSGRHDAR